MPKHDQYFDGARVFHHLVAAYRASCNPDDRSGLAGLLATIAMREGVIWDQTPPEDASLYIEEWIQERCEDDPHDTLPQGTPGMRLLDHLGEGGH